tara:strand:- start:2880 stop:3803 length:924 start_codon:yes stop_codon:yes gene_type:complete
MPKTYKEKWEHGETRAHFIKNWEDIAFKKEREWLKKTDKTAYDRAEAEAQKLKKEKESRLKDEESNLKKDRGNIKQLKNGYAQNKMPFASHRYETNRKDIQPVVDFSYSVRVKDTRSGGTKKRQKGERIYSNFQGKMAERILYDDLPNKDDFNDIDLELLPRGEWDNSDISSKDGRINFNVKSGLDFHQILLLTEKDYDTEGRYKHHKENSKVEKEIFAYVRLKLDRKELISKFSIYSKEEFTDYFIKKYPIIEYDIFFSDSHRIKQAIRNGNIICRGCMLEGNTSMDANNYYLLVYNMDQTLEELL